MLKYKTLLYISFVHIEWIIFKKKKIRNLEILYRYIIFFNHINSNTIKILSYVKSDFHINSKNAFNIAKIWKNPNKKPIENNPTVDSTPTFENRCIRRCRQSKLFRRLRIINQRQNPFPHRLIYYTFESHFPKVVVKKDLSPSLPCYMWLWSGRRPLRPDENCLRTRDFFDSSMYLFYFRNLITFWKNNRW